MSKSQSKQKLGDRILACLEEGEKDISEIQEAVGASKNSVSVCLTGLVKSGKVVRVRSGVYRLAAADSASRCDGGASRCDSGGGKFAQRDGKRRNN